MGVGRLGTMRASVGGHTDQVLKQLQLAVRTALGQIEGLRPIPLERVSFTRPPKDHRGVADLCVPCFPFAQKQSKGTQPSAPAVAPQAIAEHLAQLLQTELVSQCVSVGPYLNLQLDPVPYVSAGLNDVTAALSAVQESSSVNPNSIGADLIEFSSPNTNKPQHLGHARNVVLGESVARLWQLSGRTVSRVNLINDRGIHICKSMLAYERRGGGETPESSGMKGDHLVGKYYVLFEEMFQEEYAGWFGTEEAQDTFTQWQQTQATKKPAKTNQKKKQKKAPTNFGDFRAAYKQVYFNKHSELGDASRAMLTQWEERDAGVHELWQQMKDWCTDGFDQTHGRLGIHFDRIDFESNTYLRGKEMVKSAVESGRAQLQENGSVAVQTSKGRTKVLLREDGTSVYTTQDLGTAMQRYETLEPNSMTYVVADEQNTHFEELFEILGLLHPTVAPKCHHLSYGMVRLPNGRMKSREGIVVDVDNLLDEVRDMCLERIQQKHDTSTAEEQLIRAEAIAVAALKFEMLVAPPASSITFDPERSLELTGRTGPYCLYTYARARTLLRKNEAAETKPTPAGVNGFHLLRSNLERAVVYELFFFASSLADAGQMNDPSKVTSRLLSLAEAFNSMYTQKETHPILSCDDEDLKAARLALTEGVASAMKAGLCVLNIPVLESI